MSKNTMLLCAAALIGFLPLAASAEEYVKDGNPCLGGVCVGDDMMTHIGVKWIPAPRNGSQIAGARKDLADEKQRAKIIAPQPADVIRDAAPYLADMMFDVDAKGLTALSKVKGYCTSKTIWGTFLSESGYPTKVEAQLTPSADGKVQTFVVTTITRGYPVMTDAQAEHLFEELKKHYATIRYDDYYDIRTPKWKFNAGGGGTGWLQLQAVPKNSLVEMKERELFLHYPGCTQAVNMN